VLVVLGWALGRPALLPAPRVGAVP